MAGFKLNDVRETFSADMTAMIEGIDRCSVTLLGAQALSLSLPRAEGGGSLLDMVASHAHAVYGSSSLVSVDSMASSARALEALAHRGSAALAQLETQLDEVRTVARLCQEGASEMRTQLALELDGRGTEANDIARALVGRLTAPSVQKAPQSELPDSIGPREFNFDDDDEVVRSGPGSVAVKDELLGSFQQEARELLVALQGHLQVLASHPKDLHVAGQLERIYHTLKGAAGTVGLPEVATMAGQLQAVTEELAEGGLTLNPARLGEIFRHTNRMLRASSLPEISLDLLSSAEPTAHAGSARTFFVEETQAIIKETAELIDVMTRAGKGEGATHAKRLSQLFHRLKGTALVLGDHKVAEVAAAMHAEAIGSLAVPVLQGGLANLRALMSAEGSAASSVADVAPLPPSRQRHSVTTTTDPELWEAFLQECSELLKASDHEVFGLESSAQPKVGMQALMRHVHTLKGAVNAVGLSPTGAMLHQVEDFLERLAEAPILPSMKNVTSFFIEVLQEVRHNLVDAPKGSVLSSKATVAAAAANVMAGGRAAAPREGGSSAASARKAPGDTGRSSGYSSDLDEADRRQIRVATQRLDELMNLAGELVVSRSRLLSRVGTLRGLQVDLGRSRRSLYARVDDFRQQYEFSGMAAGRRHRPVAMGLGVESTGAPEVGFSELEFDRYEDVNILARSLAEISDDLAEMDGQLSRELSQIATDSESFSGLISRIQSEVTQARMISAQSVFSRLQLPVREAAERGKKDVQLRFEESSVNLDKTIVDALFKPMLHLVRNAVHHGIELPQDRVAASKPRTGSVLLRAQQESGRILVEVSDDGRGLDLAGLKAAGVAAGLVGPDVPLDAPEVKNLVFAPGISTALTVDDVAGRGVGGDVVRRAIERLNGDIRVDSTPGRGTVFSITLPLTLVITQALVVRSGQRLFALPLFFTERIVELESAAMTQVLRSAQLKVADQYLPVRRLEQVFEQNAPPRSGPVVVLRIGERRLALQVDALVAREEVVVKNMGELLGGHPLFAGVTVRGNGDLVLIVDVLGLMDAVGIRGVATLPAEKSRAGSATASGSGASSSQSALPSSSSSPSSSPSSPSSSPPPPAKAPAPAPAKATAPRPTAQRPAAPAPQPSSPRPPAAKAAATQPAVLSPAVRAEPATGSSAAAGRAAAPRVLFVDDSLSVRKVAEKVLADLGVQVTVAVDGADALEKLRRAEFDLLFTDLEMPRVHGYELIREVRFIPRYQKLPIVVVSSRSGPKHQEQARQLGATDYLTKPFTSQMLERVLQQYLSFVPPKPGER